MLKHYELEKIRKLLFFSQAEAAKMIGKVTHRSWSRWEAGENPIPEDIILITEELLEYREELLDYLHEIKDEYKKDPAFDGITLIFYLSIEDFMYNNDCANMGRKEMLWRPYESAITQFYSDTLHLTKTVQFDIPSYEIFLNKTGKKDSQQSRIEWAVGVTS